MTSTSFSLGKDGFELPSASSISSKKPTEMGNLASSSCGVRGMKRASCCFCTLLMSSMGMLSK